MSVFSDDESSDSDKEVEEETEDHNISELSTSVILPSILGHSIGLLIFNEEEKRKKKKKKVSAMNPIVIMM